MSKKLRVVHYLNQFFAQYGGEDTAGMELLVREEAIGPGTAINKLLEGKGEIVATIVCGDNYAAENLESVTAGALEIVKKYEPDLFIAGPGLNAGRYGMACGAITSAVHKKLKIPAVTGLFWEAPGAELYSGLCYVIGTDNNARGMAKDLEKMLGFALKLVNQEDIGSPKDEGYLGSGPLRPEPRVPGAARAVNMALDKFYGRKFVTEIPMPQKEIIPASKLNKALSEAKIALVTDGGLVPKGNPDRMVPVNSVKFAHYSFDGQGRLNADDYEVKHQGYDNTFVLQDPNRLVPVDAMRQLETQGVIGKLWDTFYTTAGVMTTLENSKKFGKGIAELLKKDEVDAVVLTST